MAPLLTVSNLMVTYDEVIVALRSVSIDVPEGGVIAVLGPNGAGKSSLLRAISNVLKSREGKVEHGRVEFAGTRIDRDPPEAIARRGIRHVAEGGGLFPDLSVRDNLRLGTLHASSGERLDLALEYFPLLRPRLGVLAGYLSGGEQQMLALGRALLARPRLLLLDEPSLGLAPRVTADIFAMIRRINAEAGASILLVEQNARRALEIASYGYVMESGRIVLDGAPDVLRSNRELQEFYLGFSRGGGRKSYRDVKHYKRKKRWLS